MSLSGGQKFFAWAVILGAAALCTGSAAPYWVNIDILGEQLSTGFWYYCAGSQCEVYAWANNGFADFTVFFYASHAACGLSTLVALFVGFVLLAKVCGDGDSVTGPGIGGLIAGLLGAACAVLFYLKTEEVIGGGLGTVGWAFYVYSSGAGVLLLFSIVLMAIQGTNKNAVGPY